MVGFAVTIYVIYFIDLFNSLLLLLIVIRTTIIVIIMIIPAR